MPTTPIIEMRAIDKHFGAVHALRGIDFHLMPGEILGLVGDNSAGKSTLMKVLTGAYQRDAGEVLIDGKITHFRSPQDSRDLGIEMIYQDFALCVNMDIGQNIFLGLVHESGELMMAHPQFVDHVPPLAFGRDFGVLGEDPFAFAGAPHLGEPIVADEDVGRSGIAGSPQQG